ncbi:MAG: hypothetical protein PHC88_05780 [Terrimicrobiaceae bacterium]|nr:hypothetical protein [Terrimicrobiaceae bacterium]
MRCIRALACFAGLLPAAALHAAPVYGGRGHHPRLRHPASDSYVNGTLRASQPNYYWLFSGSNQGILTDTHPDAPFTNAANLYTALAAAGRTFGGLVGAHPRADSLYHDGTNYAVRHVPWPGFSNVPAGLTESFTTGRPAAAHSRGRRHCRRSRGIVFISPSQAGEPRAARLTASIFRKLC